MYAQNVAEYGALASTKTNLELFASSIRDWVSQAGPGVWLALGAFVILIFWFKRR
jgi:hypothetical protein